MEIGILTYHHAENYGALLQSYALSEAVKEYGHQVEFIDYRPYRAIKYYWQETYLSSQLIAYSERSKNMKKFFLNRLKLSQKTYYHCSGLQELSQQYNVVITGSDEVWNVKSIRKFNPSYFLDFIDDKIIKISYAASLGRTKTFGKYSQKISNLLQRFDAVSVRDLNSLEVIRRECGLEAKKVLDPTFLSDFTKITSIPKLEKYALVYGRLKPQQAAYVKVIAESKGLPVISVGYPCKVAQEQFLSIGPEEWLGYFANASYIFTDFYHGAIFSIICKKPFVFFGRKDKANKINDLLTDLNLEDRLLTEETTLKAALEIANNMDYNVVYAKLEPMIQKSKAYLGESINGRN